MSRPSPAISVSTSAPAIANGHVSLLQPPEKQAIRATRAVSMSVSKTSLLDDSQYTDVDPDKLFMQYPISEVKFVQQRLRADADAKQEELRLMVGERYRDLLQASSSIISIATSAQRVKQALEETKEIILSQEEPPLPQRTSIQNGNDTHLYTLQLLSAHIKLLLDAPEHLWRIIERKKYLTASWLFLLARVVHRSLVREDEQDIKWSTEGVNILEDFPLVQRQWETVSQFRSQIIHKATLSLRDYDSTVEDTCAIMVTLHLLDSRPLTETLSVFLSQRSKTLHSSLSWQYNSNSAELSPHKQNGHAVISGLTNVVSSDFRRRPVKEIKEATHTALDAIARTVKAAKGIFEAEESRPSLVRRVLEHIQSDSSSSSDTTHGSPTELYLTTQSLLTTLPSSTHFLLLPPDLRSYKPYVDLDSSSSLVQPSQFTEKLGEWFQKSISNLQKSVTRWFSDLHSVKELWSVRTSTLRWLPTCGLERDELSEMTRVFDDLCRHRAVEIWKLRITGTLDSFSQRLDSNLLSLTEGGISKHKEIPINFLFQSPPIPTSSLGSVDTSFQKYTTALRRQLVGRTALLDDVLATLESCARTIRQDLAHVMSGNESSDLIKELETAYRPEADALCATVIERLEKTMNASQQTSTTDGLVFMGRLSEELSTSSTFVSEIGCQPSVLQDFRKSMAALHDRLVDRWRTHTIALIVSEHRISCRSMHRTLSETLQPSGPSSDLIQSLLSLCTSIQEFGVPRRSQQLFVEATLVQFITQLLDDDDGWDDSDLRSLYDVAFLWKLSTLYGKDISSSLENRLQKNLPSNIELEVLEKNAGDSLARTQTLLATLLPVTSDKASTLLRFGVPGQEGQYQPAIELAKPTSRFGLLLVGGA